jgi:1-acyl-sn-glycerol-3-phosphate acyltransferase
MPESGAHTAAHTQEEQRQNGSDPSADGRRNGSAGLSGRRIAAGLAGHAISRLGSPVARVAGPLVSEIRSRMTADLDDRDPDFIREQLPTSWLLSSIWFRGEVRGLENIPEDRPVLLVGNHSGGNVPPDTIVFTLAFNTYFGVERPFYQLAHNLVLASPYGQYLRKFGTVAASHENARKALDAGAAVLVYPGGDHEVHRPSSQSNRIDFDGRKGFLRLALEAGVPIVPVVAIGGQETALFLSNGRRLAQALRLDKLLRLKVLPISIALPWGINVGDFLGHLPLPAKITVQVLEPIDIRRRFGRDPDLNEAYERVTGVMQDTLSALAAERRLPVIG